MYLWWDLKDNSKDSRSLLCSSDMLVCIFGVSLMIPKNVRQVNGPSIFEKKWSGAKVTM